MYVLRLRHKWYRKTLRQLCGRLTALMWPDLTKAREIAELVSPEAVWPQDMYLAAISEKERRLDLAVSLIGPVMRFISSDYFSISSAYAARIYLAAGRLDSAYHYAHKLVASSSPRNRQNGYKILLAPEMASYIPADTARRYVREYREVIESLLSRHDAEAALIQNSMYNYQVHERERHRAEADKMRYERRPFSMTVTDDRGGYSTTGTIYPLNSVKVACVPVNTALQPDTVVVKLEYVKDKNESNPWYEGKAKVDVNFSLKQNK